MDGGMNQTFLSAVRNHGGAGASIRTAAGTIPAHARPPSERSDNVTGSTMSLASAKSRPAQAPRSSVQVASADNSGGIGSFFSNLFGSKSEDKSSVQWGAQVGEPASKQKAAPAAAKPARAAATAAVQPKSEPQPAARPKSDPQPAASRTATAYAPQPTPPRQEASAETDAKPASTLGMLNGAAPTVPAGGFEGRFGPWR